MNPIYTSNDTTIEIKIIDENNYYKVNIPNNEANKKLIENPKSNFKFDKCGSGIIMHDDIHVFQLYKMECNYSDYIEMQNKLENTEKEVLLLKNKIDNNECIMTVLQQQILKKLINNEHLMQQQMKIYYDKETEQMKVCEDLPYIIVKSMISTTTEIILHEESQFMMCPTNCKMFKYMNDNDNNIIRKGIKYDYLTSNPGMFISLQFIIPPKKMVKIWIRTYPKKINERGVFSIPSFSVNIYTSGIHFINQVDAFAYWYGNVEYKDDVPDDFDFKYIYNKVY